MINNYRTDYPNQVHQLNVSVSKHYYFTKAGLLKYQIKKQEMTLDKLTSSDRSHIVHFVIRDHFSGLFYAELGISSMPLAIHEFLYRAWAEPKNYSFYGIPDTVTVPEILDRYCPSLQDRLGSLGIHILRVTSGFQGGIRDIRTIEDYLKIGIGLDVDSVAAEITNICCNLNGQVSRTGKESKLELWHNNIKKPLYAPQHEWLK